LISPPPPPFGPCPFWAGHTERICFYIPIFSPLRFCSLQLEQVTAFVFLERVGQGHHPFVIDRSLFLCVPGGFLFQATIYRFAVLCSPPPPNFSVGVLPRRHNVLIKVAPCRVAALCADIAGVPPFPCWLLASFYPGWFFGSFPYESPVSCSFLVWKW